MSLLTRNRMALLVALPAVLVPAIEIPLVLWARATFISLHPSFRDDPPTISRSINDPLVGGPFAQFILVITALILAILPVILLAYARAIARVTTSRRQRWLMNGMLIMALFLQLAASAGMVLTTQFTFDIDRDLHMLGSYVFFVFQALSILVAASLCRVLHNRQREQGIADHEWQFRPFMHRFRFRFAMVILGLVVLYGILFVLKDHVQAGFSYWVQLAYTQCEVTVIACYVIFLGSYGIDIYHMIRHDTLRLGVPNGRQAGNDLRAPVER